MRQQLQGQQTEAGRHRAGVGMPRKARRVLQTVLDILLPPRCANCGVLVRTPGLCAGCWQGLTFLTAPQCGRCGAPYPYVGAGDPTGCPACPPVARALDRGRAALVYDAGSRDLLLGFKHADRTDRTRLLAGWMQAAAADLWPEVDLIIPVPLHWRRLWRRQYNQAALLASALAKRTGTPCAPRALHRVHIAAQKGLSATARRQNVRGQFRVRQPERIRGQRVLIVDDVWTTGATLGAIAESLKAAGASAVFAVTAARVLLVDNSVDNFGENCGPAGVADMQVAVPSYSNLRKSL